MTKRSLPVAHIRTFAHWPHSYSHPTSEWAGCLPIVRTVRETPSSSLSRFCRLVAVIITMSGLRQRATKTPPTTLQRSRANDKKVTEDRLQPSVAGRIRSPLSLLIRSSPHVSLQVDEIVALIATKKHDRERLNIYERPLACLGHVSPPSPVARRFLNRFLSCPNAQLTARCPTMSTSTMPSTVLGGGCVVGTAGSAICFGHGAWRGWPGAVAGLGLAGARRRRRRRPALLQRALRKLVVRPRRHANGARSPEGRY